MEKTKKNGLGKAAMICGILALCLFACFINFVFAIAAIALGAVSISTHGKSKDAIIGIVCAVLSVVLCIGGWSIAFSNKAFTNMIYEMIEDSTNSDDSNIQFYYREYNSQDGMPDIYFDEGEDSIIPEGGEDIQTL